MHISHAEASTTPLAVVSRQLAYKAIEDDVQRLKQEEEQQRHA